MIRVLQHEAINIAMAIVLQRRSACHAVHLERNRYRFMPARVEGPRHLAEINIGHLSDPSRKRGYWNAKDISGARPHRRQMAQGGGKGHLRPSPAAPFSRRSRAEDR